MLRKKGSQFTSCEWRRASRQHPWALGTPHCFHLDTRYRGLLDKFSPGQASQRRHPSVWTALLAIRLRDQRCQSAPVAVGPPVSDPVTAVIYRRENFRSMILLATDFVAVVYYGTWMDGVGLTDREVCVLLM